MRLLISRPAANASAIPTIASVRPFMSSPLRGKPYAGGEELSRDQGRPLLWTRRCGRAELHGTARGDIGIAVALWSLQRGSPKGDQEEASWATWVNCSRPTIEGHCGS